MLSLVAALIAFFTILSASGLLNKKQNDDKLVTGILWLVALALCVAIPWIANLGLLSSVRHFFVKDLEKELADRLQKRNPGNANHVYTWNRVVNSIITLNHKKVGSGI